MAIAVLAVASYVPALSGGFVWDDVIFAEEPVIHAGGGLRTIWFSPADIKNEGHYWPLVYTSFWLEHKLWGLQPAGYHAVNIALHLANCLLLWRLLARLRVPGAAFIAAVFAAHPVHVESVAWIIERKDVLSALFYLSAVLVWIRFVEQPRPARYVLALGLFAAGLLSKSVVVTLPVALLILHWWQRGRVTRIDLLRLIPFVVAAVGITAGDLSFYISREPLELGYTLVDRALIASRALWFYAGKLLWPADLAVIYPLWEIDAGDLLAWVYLVAAAALAAGLWLARQRIGRGPLAGMLYFAVTLGPVLGFMDYGYMQFSFVADRFQYLAGIGLLAVLIGGSAHAVTKLPEGYRRGAMGLAAVAVMVLVMLTWRQAGVYRDEITLFSHVIAHNPEARDAHLNLGSALGDAGRNEEALEMSRIAVERRPDSAKALANVGMALIGLERFEEAEAHLRRAVQVDPRSVTAHQNLAEALRRQARYAESVASFQAVLEIDDAFALAYAGMGMALYEDARYRAAVTAMEQAMALQPDLPMASSVYLFLGRAERELGRYETAARFFERSLAIDPENMEPLLELAKLAFVERQPDEADRLLRSVRELRPGDPAPLHAAAEVLRAQGRYEDAIADYRAALGVDAGFAPSYVGLGIALFEAERYAEATEALQRALDLNPDVPLAGSSLLTFLGRAAMRLGRPDAAGYFARAVEEDPHDTEAADYLALIRFGEQRYEDALALYRTMIEIEPDNALSHSNAGAALYRLGRLEEALASIERALAIAPDLEVARAGERAVNDALARRR